MNLADVLVGFEGDFFPAGVEEADLTEPSVAGEVLLTMGAMLTGTLTGDCGTSSFCGNGTWGHSSSSGLGVVGGTDTMAAVRAMLCDEEVKAAVHELGKWTVSSVDFGMGGITEWGAGKGAP